jgi:hypothetical protein
MTRQLPKLGWREWIALPEMKLPHIKAKVDTGARTSTLHAFFIDPFHRGKQQWVRFGIHPHQHNNEIAVECEAPVKDRRLVADSGGHRQKRFIIETKLIIGRQLFQAEMTLTNRDSMKFRMLLGRTAMKGRFIVDPEKSYLQGEPDRLLINDATIFSSPFDSPGCKP